MALKKIYRPLSATRIEIFFNIPIFRVIEYLHCTQFGPKRYVTTADTYHGNVFPNVITDEFTTNGVQIFLATREFNGCHGTNRLLIALHSKPGTIEHYLKEPFKTLIFSMAEEHKLLAT